MRIAAILALGVLAAPAMSLAQPAIVVDGNGRTVRAASHVSRWRRFRIEIPAPQPVPLCGGSFEPGALFLRFDEQSTVMDPYLVTGDPIEHGNGGFVIDPTRSGVIVYNIVRRPVSNPSALDSCEDLIDAKKQGLDLAKAKLEQADLALAAVQTRVARLEAQIKSQQQDALPYSGTTGASAEVKALIDAVAQTRTSLLQEQANLDTAQTNQRTAKKELDDYPGAASKELGASIEDAEYLYQGLVAGAVIKMGVVFVGDNREAVFYDFTARPANSTLHLQPLGDYPIVTYGERTFAIIANVDTKRHPYPFRLTASVLAGTPVNTEPVRPTFPAGAEAMLVAVPNQPVSARAMRDVVLPVRDTIPPNGIPEVTIVTERPTAADPKKLESVTLVEKVKYPQHRARYRYNFTSGVYRSSLRALQLTKVKIEDDNPETKDVNETRYRTDRRYADPTIQPVFSVSYHVFPVDIQSRAGWREWLPAPTLAFAFNKPHENVYAGVSHEPWRNVHVFWGWHYGMEAEEIPRNDVSEEKESSPPPTRDRRKAHFSFGVSFNIAVIAKVFK